MYKTTELTKAQNDFQNVFQTSLDLFYDEDFSNMFQKICIDIAKFDDWLHDQFGDYENDDKSMQDVIIEHYKTEGDKLINELI